MQMQFEKYQHVERFGKPDTQGIEDGMCYVFPQLDGTNASVWWDAGVQCGSRNRHLTDGEDNQGFKAYITEHTGIGDLLRTNKGLRLYGEWLVPHTIRNYRESAWRKFYVFDVMYQDRYLTYDEYKPLLDEYEVDYVPCMWKVDRGAKEDFHKLLDQNFFLMPLDQPGEGIVIKRYDFVNKFGRVTWAKIVRSEFKAEHVKAMGPPVLRGKDTVEEAIVEACVTQTLVDKERAKIDTTPIQPRLIGMVWHCLLTEELADQVKDHKNPVIDFRLLNRLTINKVKKLAADLF